LAFGKDRARRGRKTIDLTTDLGTRRAIAHSDQIPPPLMSLSDASLKADAIDHLAQPTSPTASERRGLTLALIAAAALHLLIPVALLVIAAFAPRPAPPIEEIPVEVVVEKPPPPPAKPPPSKPPEDRPKPPPQPEDEKPAYDAPSAATAEKANRDSPDKTTSAPETPSEKPQTPGAPQDSKETAAAEPPKAQAAPTPQETPPAESADTRAAPTPAAEDAVEPPPAPVPVPADKPSPPPAPRAKAPVGTPPPSADVLPDYKFAHAATESPIVGGSAETRYFTIVYGMIRAHMRMPRDTDSPRHEGAVVFALDETGNLLQRRVVMSSGSANLDMSVMNAIAEAAPFPAPPGWQPRALRLTYGR
jgi:TonB family protein